MLGIPLDGLKEAASVALIKAVVALRLVKEPCEIAEIDKACNLGYTMHVTAMKMMRLGMVEQEIVGVMEGVCHSGGVMTSFPTILSQHGETLHNHCHDAVLTEGRLCVIDAGVEIASHYCSDNTRTLPTGGKFTQKQKDIYNIINSLPDAFLPALLIHRLQYKIGGTVDEFDSANNSLQKNLKKLISKNYSLWNPMYWIYSKKASKLKSLFSKHGKSKWHFI